MSAECALSIGILDNVEFMLKMVAYCIAGAVYVLDRAALYTDDDNSGSVSLGNVCMGSDDWKVAIAITTICQ